MKYLKRDANVLLILLAVILLFAFIGSGIFFQIYLASMNKVHAQDVENLNTLRTELEDVINTNTNLNSTIMNLTSKYQGQKQEIKDALSIIEEEKDKLSTKLNSTEKELALAKSQLSLSQVKLKNTQTALAEQQAQVANLTMTYASIEDKIGYILKDVSGLISDIDDYIDNNQTTKSRFRDVQDGLKTIQNKAEDINGYFN